MQVNFRLASLIAQSILSDRERPSFVIWRVCARNPCHWQSQDPNSDRYANLILFLS
jgi:hypothetical protein